MGISQDTSGSESYLKRYTTLPVLLDVLKRKKLALLKPDTWEDRNDVEFMKVYKARRKVESLYALCFSMGLETIHHWKTYANGISGCCIEFNGQELKKIFDSLHLRHGAVVYKKINEVAAESICVADIPFTKRWPYRCEEEYRVISEREDCQEVEIDLWMINRITISQQMPRMVYTTIKDYLREGCNNPDQRINHSTVYENSTWIRKFSKF